MDADRASTGVAEEYLGGAVSLGKRFASLSEECITLSRALDARRVAVPQIGDTATGLASAMERIVDALEPATDWGDRSAAILADWT